jgi:DNA primase
VDLYSLVEKYAGPGRTSGNTVTCSCPNPAHPDYSPSFTVSTHNGKQSAKCWSQCAWSGDALELVKWLEGINTGEAAKWLRKYLGKPEDHKIQRKPEAPKKSTPPARPIATQRPTTEKAAHFLSMYLSFRSWPISMVEAFSLEVVLDSYGQCRVRHASFTPTLSGEWQASYWQDRRRSSGQGAKWLSPHGVPPVLYNLRSLERDELTAVVICEGPADTITATLALEGHEGIAVIGVPGVNAWRSEWAELLTGLRVVVAADNDEAGKKLEEAVANSVRKKVKAVQLQPQHNDLTDTAKALGLSSVRRLLLSAVATEPETLERSLEDSVSLILAVFPEAFALEEGVA